MLKKTITYTDYNDEERTEDFYFHFTKSELLEMEMSAPGGLEARLKRLISEHDNKKIVEWFKDLVLKSYGVKSEDGRRFIKSPEAQKAFSETEAYNELYWSLATDAGEGAKFVNGILPRGLDVAVNQPSLPAETA